MSKPANTMSPEQKATRLDMIKKAWQARQNTAKALASKAMEVLDPEMELVYQEYTVECKILPYQD